MKPEMKINECIEIFRANQLSRSQDILVEEILAGKFRWAGQFSGLLWGSSRERTSSTRSWSQSGCLPGCWA